MSEKYLPSRKELENAENSMTPEQKRKSDIRAENFTQRNGESDMGQNKKIDLYQKIEEINDKIETQGRIEKIRNELGAENINEKMESFLKDLPNINGYLDFGKLKKIGGGGTHDVYAYPENQSFVIKLNKNALDGALKIGQAEFSPENRKLAEEYLENENQKNDQLYEYFGNANCLREKVLTQKLAIETGEDLKKIEGVISLQEASDIFNDPERIDFSTDYAEKDSFIGEAENEEAYEKMNDSLLGGKEFDEKYFLKFNEKLRKVFELIEGDGDFSDRMREFLLRFKNYHEATGRFVDLVGKDNVIFHQQNGKWEFKLGSVIKAENKQVMEEVFQMLEQNPDALKNNGKLDSQLLNQLALIRLLNAVGLKSGIGKIIDIELTSNQLRNLDRIRK